LNKLPEILDPREGVSGEEWPLEVFVFPRPFWKYLDLTKICWGLCEKLSSVPYKWSENVFHVVYSHKGKMSSTKKRKKILSLKHSIQQKEEREKTATPWHIKCKGVPFRLETNSENDFSTSLELFLHIVSRN